MSETPVKWTAAGLTPAGNALQAALLGTGDGLTFTRAVAADAEGVERLDLTLQAPCTVDGPKCRVPVLLTNAGVETGFTMTELRFYVRRVTDGAPTGEEVLYATVTDETGDPIPTAAQSPGFTIDWAFVFQFGNASEVTVTLDPVGLVSIGMVGQPNGVAGLDENGAVPIEQGGTGETTVQAALAALGAGVRPNELDNAYFVGGGTGWGVFPVNQRGVSGTISTPGYFIDRWKLVSGTVQITAAGLVLNGTIAQILPSSIGSIYTATALTTEGLLTCQYDDVSRTFTVTGTGQTFVFAKLERGVGQTAAYQDANGEWQQLPQPDSDYAIQLEKCQAYLLDITPDRKFNASYVGFVSGQDAVFMVPIPTTMRTIPIVICNPSQIQIAIKGTSYVTPESVSIVTYGNNYVTIIYKIPDTGLTEYAVCDFRTAEDESKVLLSAEL